MRIAALILAAALPVWGRAQELAGAEREEALQAAREQYYSLTGMGVRSFTCGVNFDLETISKGLLPESDAADRALLRSATFSLKVTPIGAVVRYQFPEGSVSQSQDVVAGVTTWITQIVQGFFQTWPVKGFSGPIPGAKQVEKVLKDGDGYRVTAKEAGTVSELRLDKDLVVREIVSQGREGEIDERPVFTRMAGGLVFVGNETVDKDSLGVTKVQYEIEQGQMSGVLLPKAVHLVVGEHVEVRFGLSGCKVVRR